MAYKCAKLSLSIILHISLIARTGESEAYFPDMSEPLLVL